MSKRVLIIGYWYGVETMGGVRLRRIARLLPQYGWDPVILMPPWLPASGAQLPKGVRIEEVRAPDLAAIYTRLRSFGKKGTVSKPSGSSKVPVSKDTGFSSKLNRWLMVPDKQAPWYRAAVRRGRELVRREKFDAIFASLDPRTCLLVAAKLSEESAIPCVLEYRDLWTGNPYYHLNVATPLHRLLHERLERKALRRAKFVSAVCRGIAQHLTTAYGELLRAPVQLNYNFFDPEEYPSRVVNPPPQPFVVSYVGAFYNSRRPHLFLEGIRRFLDLTRFSPQEFRFKWAGGISGIDALSEALDQNQLRPYLDYFGHIPHREALQLLVNSDVSVLIQAPDDTTHIPGKLFEAMGARVPLLALSNPCETTEIIARCSAGKSCPHEVNAIADTLLEFARLRRSSRSWRFNELEVGRFCASDAVHRLAALFEEALP